MKTAISIPDALFDAADRLARERGWSRSQLYTNAVASFIEAERFSGVRERLDAVYGAAPKDSAVDPALALLQSRTLPKSTW